GRATSCAWKSINDSSASWRRSFVAQGRSEVSIRTMRARPPFTELRAMMRAASTSDTELSGQVAAILQSVATKGDAALIRFARELDGAREERVADLRVSPDDLARAAEELPGQLRASLRRAAENIRRFHERQVERGFLDFFPDGSVLGQRVLPLRRVG